MCCSLQTPDLLPLVQVIPRLTHSAHICVTLFSFNSAQRSRGCRLSPLRASELGSRDIVQDAQWDIYRPLFRSSCTSGGDGPYYPSGPSTSQYPPPNGQYPTRPSTPYDCFRIFEASYGLDRSAARRSILARDLRECEEECEREPKFSCSTLSFTSGTFTTNCHLTDALSTSLIRGRDFVRDYTSDVYERRDTAACRANNGQGSWDDGFQSHAYAKCSNFEMPGERLARSTSRVIVAARDVADCEDQCLQQNRFFWVLLPSRAQTFLFSGSLVEPLPSATLPLLLSSDQPRPTVRCPTAT